jgi:hypothetical protein
MNMSTQHRAEKNRLIFAIASAVIWAVGAGWTASFALRLPPVISAGLALAVAAGTFFVLNRAPVKR